MKKNTLKLALGLISLSVLFHLIHLLVFKDLHHLLIYLWGDIVFIPLEVFFVSLVLDKFIEKREKAERKNKAHMLVGLFYQELGSDVLGALIRFDGNLDREKTRVEPAWTEKEYALLQAYLKEQKLHLHLESGDYPPIGKIIERKQDLIISLLTNQSLQEHELFTETLMSLFHLLEELRQRDLTRLESQDMDHLKIDSERVYRNLARGWVDYLVYLKKAYPYLYVSAVRTDPFSRVS